MTVAEDVDFVRMADTLKIAADPTRLRIMGVLSGEDRNVGEITAGVGSPSQPSVSSHLKVLYLSGMVDRRRDGKNNIYTLTDRGRCLLAAAQSLAG